jgi:hypothetical protein
MMHTYTSRDNSMPWEFERFIKPVGFDETKGGVCAKVSILRIDYPKYSFTLGWMDDQGKFGPNFRTGYDLTNLPLVASEAKKYVDTQVATVESLRQKMLQEDKERKERKKKNWEENHKKRKAENQARANGNGGGKKNK